MSVYECDDGTYNITLTASGDAVKLFKEGKRTLVHLPTAVATYDLLRSLQPGAIGLYRPPVPRVQLTPITSVETLHLHDVPVADLVALGRSEDNMARYRMSWDQCWWQGGSGWDTNPEVYAIRWVPLIAPTVGPACPVTEAGR